MSLGSQLRDVLIDDAIHQSQNNFLFNPNIWWQ